jgi:hypothetical protein
MFCTPCNFRLAERFREIPRCATSDIRKNFCCWSPRDAWRRIKKRGREKCHPECSEAAMKDRMECSSLVKSQLAERFREILRSALNDIRKISQDSARSRSRRSHSRSEFRSWESHAILQAIRSCKRSDHRGCLRSKLSDLGKYDPSNQCLDDQCFRIAERNLCQ